MFVAVVLVHNSQLIISTISFLDMHYVTCTCNHGRKGK